MGMGDSTRYAVIGESCTIDENVVLGVRYTPDCHPAQIGDHCVIRAMTIIYADAILGASVKTGHHVTIREHTRTGSNVVIGTGTVIDGQVEIGSFVKIESLVYIPTHTRIGNHVFIGPGAVLTNDRYPQRLRDEYAPCGPIIEHSVSIGGRAVILPGVRVGKGSIVAAGAVVTRDVPEWSLAVGVPAKAMPLPEKLRRENRAKTW